MKKHNHLEFVLFRPISCDLHWTWCGEDSLSITRSVNFCWKLSREDFQVASRYLSLDRFYLFQNCHIVSCLQLQSPPSARATDTPPDRLSTSHSCHCLTTEGKRRWHCWHLLPSSSKCTLVQSCSFQCVGYHSAYHWYCPQWIRYNCSQLWPRPHGAPIRSPIFEICIYRNICFGWQRALRSGRLVWI